MGHRSKLKIGVLIPVFAMLSPLGCGEIVGHLTPESQTTGGEPRDGNNTQNVGGGENNGNETNGSTGSTGSIGSIGSIGGGGSAGSGNNNCIDAGDCVAPATCVGGQCIVPPGNEPQSSPQTEIDEQGRTWYLHPKLSDEFNYAEGTSIDLGKWYFQTDAHFNGELQDYTDKQYNVPTGEHLTDYNIKATGNTIQIVARNDNGKYTSVRINSQCRMAFKHGRIDFRLKAPSATTSGLWPAVWLLGNDINQSPRCPVAGNSQSWPGCGEVDIWEYQSSVSESFITNAFCNSGCGNTSAKRIQPGGQADKWVIVGAEWNEKEMKYWYRNDGDSFTTQRGLLTKSTSGCGCFSHDMFFLINLAVGGTLGGEIRCSFPQTLELDYIRTYKLEKP
jgi:beta-glucanase (GH16 family)